MNKTGKRQWAIGNRLKDFIPNFFGLKPKIAYRLLPIAFCLFLIGCGAKHPTLSDAHLSAVKLNQRAESSFKNSDYENALRLYNEAIKINRSIENIDGIAINIINIAATYRKLGDKDNAHKQINEILNASPIAYNPIHLSEAAFLKAMLYFDEKNYDKTLEWTDKSLTFCQSSQCSDIGKVYNLKGRAYLEKGDVASAISYGNKGLESNKEDGHKTERANSLRLIANAKLMKGEYEDARKFYEDALSIDKKLEAGRKIAMDLMGIGNTFFKQKMCGDAVKYYQRALSVIEGLGDVQGAKEAVEMINKCSQTSSKNPDKK
ncbi:MAG: tetratricopeptide repeat protein [Nitrospirota bacterium]